MQMDVISFKWLGGDDGNWTKYSFHLVVETRDGGSGKCKRE